MKTNEMTLFCSNQELLLTGPPRIKLALFLVSVSQ